jgi:hypothetical protein
MNPMCQVFEGTSKCGRPAVAVLKQEILGTTVVPAKTIRTPVCEEHARLMEQTRGTHQVERF